MAVKGLIDVGHAALIKWFHTFHWHVGHESFDEDLIYDNEVAVVADAVLLYAIEHLESRGMMTAAGSLRSLL